MNIFKSHTLKSVLWWASVFACGSFINLVFQNCSSGFKVNSTMDIPIDHPVTDPDGTKLLKVTESKIQLGDRDFIESFYKDVFLSESSGANEINFVDAVIYQ